jgi:hypothetical protein
MFVSVSPLASLPRDEIMRPLIRRNSVALATIIVSASLLHAQPNNPGKLINRDQLKCVISNLQAYKGATLDPVVIYLAICPRLPTPTEVLSLYEENSLPGTGFPQRNDTDAIKVLFLNKAELDCLKRYEKLTEDTSQTTVRLPAKLCGR